VADFVPGQGGYEAWAAAGKPTSNEGKAGNDAFQKAIGSKSLKVSKTTGKSPFQTAVASMLTKLVKDAQDAQDKATKVQTEAANKIAVEQAKATNTTPEEAQKQQDQQWAAFVKGLAAAKTQGTLPPEMWDLGFPKDVDAQRAAKGLPPLQRDQSGNVIGQVPFGISTTGTGGGGGGGGGGKAPPSDTTPGPYVPPSGPAMGGTTTAPVSKLQSQITDMQSKVRAAQAASGSGGWSWNPVDLMGEVLGGAVHAPLKALGAGVGALSVPGQMSLTAIDEAGRTALDYIKRAAQQGTFTPAPGDNGAPAENITDPATGQLIPNPNYEAEMAKYRPISSNVGEAITKGAVEGFQGKGVTGEQTLKDLLPVVGNIPVANAIAGYGLELATDPTTYTGVGIGSALKHFGIEVAPRAIEDITNEVLQSAIKTGTASATQKGVKALAERTGKTAVKAITQGPTTKITSQAAKHVDAARNTYMASLAAGNDAATALTHARLVAERSVMADAAKQKFATQIANSVKDNRRYIDIKAFGKHTGLGQKAIIDVPYQATRAAKQKILDTKMGDALNKAFNINYWFPGETHTLHNKAEAMGVTKFHQQMQDVRSAFSGLSKADRNRIATETELGHTLAGVTGTKGLDLGPAQKFFQDNMHDLFNEAATTMGKYSPDQEVKDYVYHYYRGGSPKEIDKFRTIRNSRLQAGATGTDRFTLADAKKAGLNPIEGADRILLAKMADHQRQMINDSFRRRLIDHYGLVTDNPLTAQALELEKVRAPKNMKIKEGHEVYLDPKINQVYQNVGKMGTRDPQDASRLMRHYDQIMKYWKIGNTSIRPGHHIRNAIGDIYMNYMDGVTNPYRYKQGLQMIGGNRADLKVKVGQQVVNGDQIADLFAKGGGAHGYIASEFGEGRNPFMHSLNEFSDKREMFARYAHFIDALKKEGDKVNLGANNSAGLMKAATNAAKSVNKWNINYGDLTPFEQNYMKRIIPFYTWSRKALPLVVESAATNPKALAATHRVNNLISNLAGVDPSEQIDNPIPLWLQQAGFARISGGQEPNVESLPLPSADLAKWFGSGNIDDFLRATAANTNPLMQSLFERAYGRNLATGQAVPSDAMSYGMSKLGGLSNLQAIWNAAGKHDAGSIVSGINALTGLGVYRDTENRQLSELRRQQSSLQAQVSQINKGLGDYEVHKLKNGYSVYNKKLKYTEKSGFTSSADALVYAMGLSKQGSSIPGVKLP